MRVFGGVWKNTIGSDGVFPNAFRYSHFPSAHDTSSWILKKIFELMCVQTRVHQFKCCQWRPFLANKRSSRFQETTLPSLTSASNKNNRALAWSSCEKCEFQEVSEITPFDPTMFSQTPLGTLILHKPIIKVIKFQKMYVFQCALDREWMSS